MIDISILGAEHRRQSICKVEKKVGVEVTQTSRDKMLVEFCREFLSESFGAEWALATGTPENLNSLEDLCIWEFPPAETASTPDPEAAERGRKWFVLHRKDLIALQAMVGTTDLNGVLKPVTRGSLLAFLGGANPPGNEPHHESIGLANALRIQRDEMLQFLIQANLKLQENDQERNNFLARSVHDFRAPLTAISGYCGLLLEEEFGPLTPEQRRVLGRMLHSATRLSRISNGMFQLTVPHTVDQKAKLEKGDIRDCLDQALHEVALVLEDKRISVAVEIEPAPDGLFFEKSQIEQTLVNLLDNACRFTPRDGTIEIKGYPFFWERRTGQAALVDRSIECRVRQARVFNSFRVDIRDSGPGIPAVHVDRIFEEYTSYGGGQDRSGGGLGLAICRMILNRHHGRIWSESDPGGAVFSFVLPLQQTIARPYEGGDNSKATCLAGTTEE
jgi:signal transduction histidine kinase